MSASVGIAVLVAGPVLGALCVLFVSRSRAWQIVLGAILGEAFAYTVLGAWSSYTARQFLSGQRSGLVALPNSVPWSDRLVALLVLFAFAAAVGVGIALARRVVRGRP